jgi:hypothetical protein
MRPKSTSAPARPTATRAARLRVVTAALANPGVILPLAALAAGVGLAVPLAKPSIRLDGVGYYAPLASVLLDHDLDLVNEIAHAGNFMRNTWFTRPDGRIADPYPVGTAVLWSPVMAASLAFDPARARYDDPGAWRNASPGFARRYVRTIAIATALQALLAALLLYRCLRARAQRAAALAGVVAATLGTPLLFYAVAEPSYGHVASFLACTALLAAVVRRRPAPLPLLGALWGLVSLVRYQDAVLGLLVAPRLLQEAAAARGAPVRLATRIAAFALPALAVFLPQLLFWKQQYGDLFVVPLPSGFMHWTAPQIVPFLFSTWQGAFLWSPVLAVGFAGLALVRERGLRWFVWGGVALEIYISAAADDWWGSASFGARRLVVVAPLAALGVALACDRLATTRRRVAAIAVGFVILVGWNVRLTQHAAAGRLPYNSANVMEYARHYPPDHPWRRPWGKWDYARFAREIASFERDR